jgi:hypothetical protein
MKTSDLTPKAYHALLASLPPGERDLVWLLTGINTGLEKAASLCREEGKTGAAIPPDLAERILALRSPDPLSIIISGGEKGRE